MGKNWNILVILSMMLGGLGADRFYAGRTGLGILKLLTCGGWGLWSLVDMLLAVAGKQKDGDGYYITNTGSKTTMIVITVVPALLLIAGGVFLYNQLTPELKESVKSLFASLISSL